MLTSLRNALRVVAVVFVLSVTAQAQDSVKAIAQGQRVYSVGHSFHVFMPAILNDIAQAAEIKGHKQVGLSSIGGSRVIQHWEVADDKFQSKEMLKSGQVDVLTLAPIFLPDDGIENFCELAFEHNPDIRITIQEFWLPNDRFNRENFRVPHPEPDRNARSLKELREQHTAYFQTIDEHVTKLRGQFGTKAIYVVPVGQAVLALREKIAAGEAPGLKQQTDLFTDTLGHATPQLQVLVAYCHFAVTYRRSPIGLPMPAALARGKTPTDPTLLKLMQELAWQSAIQHPLSGVKAD
ncbi:MAG TPA: hypothetical protein VK137_14625 [Planctomycetaceae bacterium]|nr:hypothetical protein [Planctomycetaceae bacterium]